MFFKRIPLSSLIELCRALRHNLGAGLSLVKVFRQQAQRGPTAVRPVADRICGCLERGESLEEALKPEQAAFPVLFVSLARVGERTGNLPEVLGELEKYYTLQQRLWRQFVSQIAWPVFQFIAAIFVIAAMILVLGLVADTTNKASAVDPIGLGLGPAGAIRWLLLVFGSLAAVGAVYLVASRSLRHKAAIDTLLLRLPVVGPCLTALAMNRFCLALRLTVETAMPIAQALRLSLRATGNAAFEAVSPAVEGSVRGGEDLTLALTGSRLFPQTFLDILAVAEEGGRVAEVMRHQSDYYEDELKRRLTVLAKVAGFGVWLLVAGLIIVAIFRIVSTVIAPAYQF
ncbi:MAG TPA: type II secretion system F family protein [Gemmataceae bacterium]|jgi:type IV pilus assembly protein PilC|nr:type II secretion system F family protein [Gemmataceae bacterium]